MAKRPRELERTRQRDRAVSLLAAGELSLDRIAADLGIAVSTLSEWQRDPGIQRRIAEELDRYRIECRRYGLAVKERRIVALQRRWESLLSIVEERRADPTHAHVPGWRSGYLKPVTFKGETNYDLDKDLLKALLDVERQAAVELGQWTEQRAVQADVSIRVEYAEQPIMIDVTPTVQNSPRGESPLQLTDVGHLERGTDSEPAEVK